MPSTQRRLRRLVETFALSLLAKVVLPSCFVQRKYNLCIYLFITKVLCTLNWYLRVQIYILFGWLILDSKDCVAIAFSRNFLMVFFGMFIAGGMMQGLMMQKQRQEGPMVPSGMRKSWHMLQTMVSKLLLIFVVSFLPPFVNHLI